MFTHLHLHSEYSLLDGMCRIQQVVARAKAMGMSSLAVTDHGVLYGAIEFYLAAKQAGIKPIIGCELYVASGSRTGKTPKDKPYYHLIVLAKDLQGYRNLLQLVTKAHLEGFYYKPRVDRELLARYSKGLVCLSACLQGEVPKMVLEGRLKEAREAAAWHRATFEDYYLEIQRHPMPELDIVNAGLLDISRELAIPVVATSDVHYIDRQEDAAHEILLCIQTNSTIQDEKRLKMAGDFLYMKSPEEMAERFADLPEAVSNTQAIDEMCRLQLEFGQVHLPEWKVPEGKDVDTFLAEMCREGLPKRVGRVDEKMEERLAYELDVIKKTRFANYFLAVHDIVAFAKRQGIMYGVRGSAAASLVLFSLGITDINPLEYDLIFERFLNIERKEMPDIDLDFQDDRRDEMIAYVAGKYTRDHVAQIITFGTLGARAALRDVGRALGMSYADVDRVAKLIPTVLNITLDAAVKDVPELNEIYQQDQAIKKLVDYARMLEGLSRHASTHAAGVVISREPLTRYVPLQPVAKGDQEGIAMTQFSMDAIAKIGLLKMDFLGLVNLTTLARARDLIKQTTGRELDLNGIPLDDRKTYELLSAGETAGVFQLDSSGMRKYIRELKPSNFFDVAAMVALYRPGPMEYIPTFIRSKQGLEPIKYPHPELANYLKETYGVVVYQEQVLFIVRAFGGYSLGEADIVRKAMGKKIPEIMQKEKGKFIEGAVKKGFKQDLAEDVFKLIEPFAGYAFNKAHSVSYAMIAYKTAYLKANYPSEYMTALLMSALGIPEKTAPAVAECHHLKITVLPPSVNKSDTSFKVEKVEGSSRLGIRFGLAAPKNVGTSVAEAVIAARNEGGEFKSIEDFCRRVDFKGLNKRAIESLVLSGAFDCLGSRGALCQNVDQIISLARRGQQLRDSGQTTMFDLFGQSVPLPLGTVELTGADLPMQEKLRNEKDLLGVYVSEHPFKRLATGLKQANAVTCGQIEMDIVGQPVALVGMVSSVRVLMTKNNRAFASVVLEDISGSVEVTVWSEVFEQSRELWVEGNVLLIEGKVKARDERVQVVCDRVAPYDAAGERTAETEADLPVRRREQRRVTIGLIEGPDGEQDQERLLRIVDVLRKNPGDDAVRLLITTLENGPMEMELLEKTNYGEALLAGLDGLVDAGNVTVRTLAPQAQTT